MYVVVYGLGNAGLTEALASFIEWSSEKGYFVSTIVMGFLAAFPVFNHE
ncbi:ArsB/NhaD family transporter [Paracerasibacillus soli]